MEKTKQKQQLSNRKKAPSQRPAVKLPLFITFEGGEGAGKTTLISKLKKVLEQEGYSVIVTREPGGSHLGDHIRELLLHHDKEVTIGSKAELFLFLAARAEHVEEVIAPALLENKIVLCDRFSDSSIAYQGHGRGLGVENVKALSAFATNDLVPNLTFFLDVDPKEGLKRALAASKTAVGKPDRIEALKQKFHQIVRKAFLAIAKAEPNRVKVIDSNQSADAVFEEALSYLKSIITSF
jgi:dTMP kinase